MRLKYQSRYFSKEFLRLEVIVNHDSVLERNNQNKATHNLPVSIMAYHFPFQRFFRAYPDKKAAEVLEKIFYFWICGKRWEREAIVEERQSDYPSGWREGRGKKPGL